MGRRKKLVYRPITINDCLFLKHIGFDPILRNGQIIAIVPQKKKAAEADK